MQALNFDTFLNLMEKNWPEAHGALMKSFPLIDRISAIHDGIRSKVLAGYSLQGGDFGILTALRRTGEPYILSPTLLRQYMLVSSGGLTKMLHRLETCGMISRVASVDDGRIKLVQLTELGKQTIENVVIQVQDSNRRVLAHFSPEEVELLDSLLVKLSNHLESESH